MKIICAGCGNTLGELIADVLVIRHRGREIVVTGVVAIRCDRCNAVWKPPVQETATLKVAS